MRRIMADAGKCLGCHTCELACASVHSRAGTLPGAVLGGEKPHSAVRVLVNRAGARFPLRCRQCEDPDCVAACPAGAMQKDPDTGVVWCDTEACIGCFLCADACPISAITPLKAESVPLKCDMCRGRAAGPACVAACPTGALFIAEGTESVFEPQNAYITDFLKGVG